MSQSELKISKWMGGDLILIDQHRIKFHLILREIHRRFTARVKCGAGAKQHLKPAACAKYDVYHTSDPRLPSPAASL